MIHAKLWIMSYDHSPETAKFERAKIKRGFRFGEHPCVAELASRAVDTRYSGFEDPRVASLEALESYRGIVIRNASKGPLGCQRDNCEASVRIDVVNDSFEVLGECALEGECLKEYWDARQENPDIIDKVLEVGLNHPSNEMLNLVCPHIGCSFVCGASIDGPEGSGGICEQKERETPVSLSLSSLDANLR